MFEQTNGWYWIRSCSAIYTQFTDYPEILEFVSQPVDLLAVQIPVAIGHIDCLESVEHADAWDHIKSFHLILLITVFRRFIAHWSGTRRCTSANNADSRQNCSDEMPVYFTRHSTL